MIYVVCQYADLKSRPGNDPKLVLRGVPIRTAPHLKANLCLPRKYQRHEIT